MFRRPTADVVLQSRGWSRIGDLVGRDPSGEGSVRGTRKGTSEGNELEEISKRGGGEDQASGTDSEDVPPTPAIEVCVQKWCRRRGATGV